MTSNLKGGTSIRIGHYIGNRGRLVTLNQGVGDASRRIHKNIEIILRKL